LDKLPKTWQNITVKQIVTHQSGLPEIWDSQEICCLKTVKLYSKNKNCLLFLNLVKNSETVNQLPAAWNAY
jgi:CubicO group peptidase (beta-lactamase class C family)